MIYTTLSELECETVKEIYQKYPKLTFENRGYEYIDKKSLNQEELEAIKTIESILSKHITGFRQFNNFRTRNEDVEIRLQYSWSELFTGVGYIRLSELKIKDNE